MFKFSGLSYRKMEGELLTNVSTSGFFFFFFNHESTLFKNTYVMQIQKTYMCDFR